MKRLHLFLPVLVAAVLAGCAARTQSHYYTLVPAADQLATVGSGVDQGRRSGHLAGHRDGDRPTSQPDSMARHYAISVQPVHVPEQVDKTQIVVREQGSARVIPLNQSLWASPLADEIRLALSAELSARLGVLDVASSSTVPASLPVWKVYVTVDRFDSVFDSRAVMDVTWHLDAVHKAGKNSRICQAQIAVPVDKGVAALVDGQRNAVRKLAGLIALQLSGRGLTYVDDPAITLKGCV